MVYKFSLLISECAYKCIIQYSNNAFQKRQKSFSFAELNSQTSGTNKMNLSRDLNKPHRIYGGRIS